MNRVNIAVCVFAALLTGSIAAGESPSPDGKTLFKQGRYRQALEYFQNEVQNGNQSTSLQYNIAVSLYRLQRYEESSKYFLKLAELPEWQPLAYYNLGLVEEAMGNEAKARKWYQLGATQQKIEKISVLSDRKLEQLAPEEPRQARKEGGHNWLTLINLSGGRDSNAASLADDLVRSSSAAADSFSELLVYAQTYVTGRAHDGVKVYGLGFARQFQEFDSLNSRVFGGGANFERPWHDFDTTSGVRLTQSRVDGVRVADQVQLRAELARRFGGNHVSFTWLPSRFFASNEYGQIDGWQQRFDLAWNRHFDPVTVKARYRLEINNRDDLETANGFSSYSPVRNSLLGKVTWQATPALKAYLGMLYQYSEYDGENRIRDLDGQVVTGTRTNRETKVDTGVEYSLNRHWNLAAEYQYINTQDTFDVYQYDKNRITAKVQFKL